MLKKVFSQPFKWRQAITSQYRDLNFKSILRYPFLKFGSDYAFHNSILVDFLIVGSNPLINLLIIERISKKIKNNKKVTIGILKLNDSDYWPYHQLSIPEVISEICKSMNVANHSNIENVINNLVKNIDFKYINIIELNSDKHQIIQFKKDDQYKTNVFHVKNNEKGIGLFSDKIKGVITSENILKTKIANSIKHILNNTKNYNSIVIPESKTPLIVLSPKVFLTSLPFGWLNMSSTTINRNTKFNHLYTEYSYGSALAVHNDIKEAQHKLIEDIKYISKSNLF